MDIDDLISELRKHRHVCYADDYSQFNDSEFVIQLYPNDALFYDLITVKEANDEKLDRVELRFRYNENQEIIEGCKVLYYEWREDDFIDYDISQPQEMSKEECKQIIDKILQNK